MCFFILADTSAAYQAGQLTGFAILFLPVFLGMLKCISLLRRPTTSKLCVTALLLALAGWLLAMSGHGLSLLLPAQEHVIRVIVGLLALLLLPAAFVLGIIGMACFDSKRHTQGRAQAGWALAVSGVFAVVAIVGAVMTVRAGILAEELAAEAASPTVIKSEEHNCALARPPRWVSVKPETLNKLACIAFRRARPEGYAIVIGEKINGEMANEDFMDAVKANMAASTSNVQDDQTVKITLHGRDFLRHTCVVRMSDVPLMPMYFEQWTTTLPGHAWQVTCWGPATSREQLTTDARVMMEGFDVPDPARVAATPFENVDRPAWGYHTRLSASAWKPWADHSQALADFAAMRPHEGLVVIPVDLGEKAPNLESAAHALLARMDIPFPSDEGWAAKSWPCAWGEGLEITGSRTVDATEYDYILRVASQDRRAQLHAGWAVKKKGDLALVRTALDAIELTTPQGMPPAPTAAQTKDRGLVLNSVGIALYQRDEFKEAAAWFRRAFELAPKDPAVLANVVDALRQSGQPKEALEYLSPRISAFPKHASLHLHHAWLLSETGDDTAASAAFLKAIEAGLKDENKALEWLQHLNGKDQHALATAAAERWMAKFPGVNSRRWHAQTIASGGDSKRGLQLLEKLSAEFPDDRRVLYDLGEAFNDADEHARAATVAEKLLADGKDSPRALMILGWSQMGRKWYREAKTTFEQADKKQPDNEVVQGALRRASAMLGQGNNSDIKTPIDPVAIPEAVRKLIAKHPVAKDFGAGQPLAWLLTAKGCHFEPGKPLRRTWLRRAHILTTEGANDLSSIEHGFDPLSERIFINHVEVRDEKGSVIASAPGDAYVMDLDDGNASHRKKLHFQIPGLRPGCTVEYEISIQDLGKTDVFPFARHLFDDSAAEVVFVTGAVGKINIAAVRTETLQTVREKDLIAWAGFNLPLGHDEPMNGFYEDRVPGVCLCGDEGTWDKAGSVFLKDIADRLKPDAKTEEMSRQLTAGLKTEREKITALAGHVQKHVSYTAIEFGTRARRPNPAAQTLQQQYGDCKDQALLTHQLLQAAGIESHLALVNTNWRVQPALPTLDQFNHMVVHVPSLGAGWLIDTTDKNLPPALWHADSLWHSHALILQPGKVRLQEPVAAPAQDSSLVESRRVIRPEDDAWHVEETLTLHGYYAAWMRGAFTGLDAAGQLHKAQGLLEKNARVHLHSFAFANLSDIAQPASLSLSYDVPGRLHDEGGLKRAAPPALWENEYLVTTFVKKRQTPFLMRYPFHFHSEVVVEGLKDITPASLQAFDASTEGGFTRWKLAASRGKDNIALRFEFGCTAGEHPAASWSKWHDEWNAALKAWDHPLVWKP